MSRIVQGRALLVKVLRYKKRTPTPGRGSLDTQALSGIQCSQSGVEGGAWAHHLAGQLRVGAVVATDVGRLALYGSQFGNDGRFLLGQLLGQRSEVSLQLGIVVLLGQGLCPVQRQSSSLPVAWSRVLPSTLALALSVLMPVSSSDTARARNSPRESQRR
jgi:hypothetical protein